MSCNIVCKAGFTSYLCFMSVDLSNLKSRAKARKKVFKKTFSLLDRKSIPTVDALFHREHEAVFDAIDCLSCGNCCRTTGPLITKRDITRISKYLGMSASEFEIKYLKVDEDEDFVLKSLPCPFLNLDNNMCSIYDVRPKACADYPLTDLNNQMKLKNLTLKNTEICPGVYEIMERLSEHTRS